MLKPKQQKFVELMALGSMTQKQIAEQLGVTEHTICDWKKNDDVTVEIDSLIRKSIRSSAAKALRVHTELLDAKNEMVRYLVAKDILDRAGYKPEDIIKLNGVVPVMFSGEAELED
jgi:DNA-binding XRE family transcriptional regulator